MAGVGFLLGAFALWGIWLLRTGRLERAVWFNRLALGAIALPFFANFMGWIFTEMGRQPWVVYGLLRTAAGVSPAVPWGEVLTTLGGFTLVYGVLAVVEGWLMLHYAGLGPREEDAEPELAPALVY